MGISNLLCTEEKSVELFQKYCVNSKFTGNDHRVKLCFRNVLFYKIFLKC